MPNPERSLVEDAVSTADGRRRLLQERAIRKVSDYLDFIIDEKGVTRSQLAERLGRTRGWVTQVLDGDQNKTIRTVADILAVLGEEIEIGSKPFVADESDSIPAVDCALPSWTPRLATWNIPISTQLLAG
jgi:transcriptional regulator with XRE-family HTH domain